VRAGGTTPEDSARVVAEPLAGESIAVTSVGTLPDLSALSPCETSAFNGAATVLGSYGTVLSFLTDAPWALSLVPVPEPSSASC
jgi:hypothetical protein